MTIRILFCLFVFSHCAFAAEKPMFFDSGVNGLELMDSESGKRLLAGTNAECGSSLELGYCYMNSSGSEVITLYVHPGSTKYSVAEIQIQKTSEEASLPEYPIRTEQFKTSKAVKLGISTEELVALLGNPNETQGEEIYYQVRGNEYLLEEYNMPIYYSKYIFNDNKLVEFKYGFQYP